ncbi:acyl dehydratase [Humitalea rosea]|uniref:Acyl dehydratase n=1 Tax=Humitalea rosea TaxID=990373 RepID=A0A2W7HWJ4_9PROT|nr:MaoC family dehydratase [Humitalea rosea]PZW37725.1 acyl dehydratase [Humitalea rosea]
MDESAAPFDPRAHRMVAEQRWFDDFRLGERFPLPSRTMTSAIFLAFQAASGDNHPVHYDREYCRARGLPDMLAHGYQVAIQTAAGAGIFPHLVEESLKAFLEQSSRFLHPVFVGDTLYPALEVDELTPRAGCV